MFAEEFPDFREREFVDVVVGQAQAVARRKSGKRIGQTGLQCREVAIALRIRRRIFRGQQIGGTAAIARGLVERFCLLRTADPVDLSLRENRVQPRG